jgi:Rps23 Pro-64 3,4-dihydroxylase Tpa1-like proline 4-hydroxylase
MTPKEILDSFSETLMQDERILSAQERALLANLLHHARTSPIENQEAREAGRSVIVSALGETIAHRAFTVLGASIAERLLERNPPSQINSTSSSMSSIYRGIAAKEGREMPPTPMDEPVSPSPEPASPGKVPRRPSDEPISDPTSPSDPISPGHGFDKTSIVARTAQTGVATMERPPILKAQCVVLDEFLTPQEIEELIHFALENENNFAASEVVSPNEDHGIVNYEHRRSRVLMDLKHHEERIFTRIKSALPQVLRKLEMEDFAISNFEAQITASNDGDFFRLHSDNGSDRVASRYLTFVYFFHREPRQFEGGELRIHNAHLGNNGIYVSDGTYQTIVPLQNQIVFFPCKLRHEIMSVNCPSGRFADSRFTLNGWLGR